MPDKIQVENLFKVFGPHTDDALRLARQGKDKDEIFRLTRSTVGVHDASFGIRAGEVFVIMGLSGSGKSTLVRLLNRLIEPTAGRVLIDGRDVVQMSRDELIGLRRREIAMVFQSFALLPHLTVLENAAFGLEVAGFERDERRERALATLEQVGLEANAESYPDELSGGMQQRVGLARALAADPDILLMDEAFSALDPLIRRGMQEELLRLQEQRERTVVFISHDLDEAMRIGDRIAMMEGGRVLQVGTPREILAAPATDYIATFFRDVDTAQVYTAGDVVEDKYAVFRGDEDTDAVGRHLEAEGHRYGYLVDDEGRFEGVVSPASLAAAEGDLDRARLPEPRSLRSGTRLSDALGIVAGTPYPVPVLGRHRRFLGALSRTALLGALEKGE